MQYNNVCHSQLEGRYYYLINSKLNLNVSYFPKFNIYSQKKLIGFIKNTKPSNRKRWC